MRAVIGPSTQAGEKGGESGPNGPVGLSARAARSHLRGGVTVSSLTMRCRLPSGACAKVPSITLKPGS